MPLSILHIGLPLDHPSIPTEERDKVASRLAGIQARMRAVGYRYEILHASPETGLEAFKAELRIHSCDGVLLGGAINGPAMSEFKRQILDAAHEAAPQAKIMLFNHHEDVRDTIERCFSS